MAPTDDLTRRTFLKHAGVAMPVITQGHGGGSGTWSETPSSRRDVTETVSPLQTHVDLLPYRRIDPSLRGVDVLFVTPQAGRQSASLDHLNWSGTHLFSIPLDTLKGRIDRFVVADYVIGASGQFSRDVVVSSLQRAGAEELDPLGAYRRFSLGKARFAVSDGVVFEASGIFESENRRMIRNAVRYRQQGTGGEAFGRSFHQLVEALSGEVLTELHIHPLIASFYEMLVPVQSGLHSLGHDISPKGGAIENRAAILYHDADDVPEDRLREILLDVEVFGFQRFDSPTIEFDGRLVTLTETLPPGGGDDPGRGVLNCSDIRRTDGGPEPLCVQFSALINSRHLNFGGFWYTWTTNSSAWASDCAPSRIEQELL